MTSIDVNFTEQAKVSPIPVVLSVERFVVPFWKRALDVGFVLLTMPFLLLVGVPLALWIKMVSPGPAFFRQQRVGLGGRKFMCLKFRTMKVNADTGVHQAHLAQLMKSNHPTRKLDNTGDKRLIPGGLLVRALGFDELPQLLNVLRGDMSLVGPRPCTPFEFGMYDVRHQRRCEALPGLTGLWQVSGKNRTTFEEMIDLDIYYVDNQSLLLDFTVIARTGPAILALLWELRRRHTHSKAASAPSQEKKS
jgi:lipopolysaccharide/colanic/teichoic acid biosynthesis glycosyltransferase